MTQRKALLFVNGEKPKNFPNDLDNYNHIACTDGAYHNYLSRTAIIPEFIIGDLDSLNKQEKIPHSIKIIQTPDQNYTDFEKAILFLADKGITQFIIYGASGNASDHFLGNLSVAMKYYQKYDFMFYDNFGRFFFANHQHQIKNVKNHTISLIPLSKVNHLTITGFQYPLENQTLTFGGLISLRNKAISDTVKISFKNGNLLVFIEDL